MLSVCLVLSLTLAIRAGRRGHSPWLHFALGALGPLAAFASYQHTRQHRTSAGDAAAQRWHAAFGDASAAGPVPPAPPVEDASLTLTCGLGMLLQMLLTGSHSDVSYLLASYCTWGVAVAFVAGLRRFGNISARIALLFLAGVLLGLLPVAAIFPFCHCGFIGNLG